MPPKATGPSKKTATKQKEKTVEDRTFGLKNKSKSKKVQQYVQSVRMQIHGNSKKSAIDPAEARRLKKEAEKAKQAELLALFRPAETEKDKQRKKELEEAAAAAAAAAGEDGIATAATAAAAGDGLESDSDLGSGDNDSDSDSDDDVLTMEDIVEEERGKIENGTPVTDDVFRQWKSEFVARLRAAQEAEAAHVEKKKEKKTTGKELFQQNAAIFVDDEGAAGKYERQTGDAVEEDGDQLQFGQDLEGGTDDDDHDDDDDHHHGVVYGVRGADMGDEDVLASLDEMDPSLLEAEFQGTSLSSDLPAVYDQATWPEPARPPKSVLVDLLSKSKRGNAKFEREQQGINYRVKVTLPESMQFRAFETPQWFPSAKTAENSASLMALHHIFVTEPESVAVANVPKWR